MRKLPSLLLVVLVVFSLAGTVLADSIRGSHHDLSSTGRAGMQTDEAQVCKFCHTPHNARRIGPLWNRASSTATYTMYSSETLDATGLSAAAPADPTPGPSRASGSDLCLSCHDGTVSVLNLVRPGHHPPTIGQTAGLNWSKLTEAGMLVNQFRTIGLNGDLSNDHPVGFDYAGARSAEFTRTGMYGLADTKQRGGQTFVDASLNVNIRPDTGDPVLLSAGIDLPLFGGKMECSSCHNVHDFGSEYSPSRAPFLRATNEESKLCLTCHLK